jgi:rhamnulokinase
VGHVYGGRLEYEVVHRFPSLYVTTEAGLKWDFDYILAEIERGLVIAGEGGPVASIGVDSWAVDYGIVDQNGRVVCTPFHYRNSRTDGIMEAEVKTNGRQLFEETGLQFLPFNTLYQLKAHLRDDPDHFHPQNTILMVPDLIHFLLGGRKAIERTNASTTQLYNPTTGTWSKPLLKDLPGVEAMLPPIVDAGEPLGLLRDDLRRNPGLRNTQIIAPATHDTASAVLAVPMEEPTSSVYVASGTWSLVGTELAEPVISEEVHSQNFSNEVGVGNTIRFLKNVMGLWIFQECALSWKTQDVEELIRQASAWTNLDETFDPDNRAFLAPGEDMPNRVRGAYKNLPNDRAQISGVIFSSLAVKTAQVAKEAASLAGQELKTIHIVGGGSQNRLLNQLIADAAGLPVVSGPVEATLIGNLMVQFKAADELKWSMRDTVRASTELETFQPRK